MAKKKRLIFTVLIFCLTAILIIYLLCYQQIANPNLLYVDGVTITDDTITVHGFNYGGLFNYLGNRPTYKDGDLYIQFYGGWKLPYMTGTNNPDFYPIENKYNNLKRIYLRGYPWQEVRLIWTIEQGAILGSCN